MATANQGHLSWRSLDSIRLRTWSDSRRRPYVAPTTLNTFLLCFIHPPYRDERHAVAARAVEEMKRYGDRWRSNDDEPQWDGPGPPQGPMQTKPPSA